MLKKYGLIALVCIVGIAMLVNPSPPVHAKTKEIQVYYDGTRMTFDGTGPAIKEERTLVPFRKIFETLGFKVTWHQADKKVTATKTGVTMELVIGSKKAKVNGKAVEMDVPAQAINGSTLVPLRFVSENSGYHVYFANEPAAYIIGIGSTKEKANPDVTAPSPSPSPAPTSGKVESFVVKGRVVNAQGAPLSGVEIVADNTFLYNSNIIGATNAKGEYRLELPNVNASYRMSATYRTQYQGADYEFSMYPGRNDGFSGSEGAIRDFTLDIGIGEVEVYSFDDQYPGDENSPYLEMGDVEFTLKPVGKLADGSTGSTIVAYPKRTNGDRLIDIPVGTYEISAVWKPSGYKEVPLLIGLKHADDYTPSLTTKFDMTLIGVYELFVNVEFP